MELTEIEKSKAHITVKIIEYLNESVVIKTILKKSTGSVSVMSFDSGQGLEERTVPFDTFVQVIEGEADVVINDKSNLLCTGSSIVIPAHAQSLIRPNGRFKMIHTIIKSGYL
jgi:quercetin dioxygenase-like cupin family protein